MNKIQIINGSIEPWRKRYLKHKILLNQVNEKKLYTLSNLKLPQNTKPEKYINENEHLILKSGHPSPLSANKGFWFGNNHFKKCNEFLIKNNSAPVKWI